MQPELYQVQSLQELDQSISEASNQRVVIHQQNTKSADASGIHRIRIRPQINYLKAFTLFILLVIAIWPIVEQGSFEFYNCLFFKMDPAYISTKTVQTAGAVILAWYFFEILITMQYYKLQWFTIIHHWLTSFAAILVLMEIYLPAAILYGIVGVAFTFPVFLLLAFRDHKGKSYSKRMEKAQLVAANYYILLLLVLIPAQILLLWNGFSKGVHDYLYVGVILLCCVAWCYDDIQLIKALRKASKRPYELLRFENLKHNLKQEQKP